MKSSIKIVAAYATVASTWIILSDRVVSLFSTDTQHMASYSTIKGIFFILVTGSLLFMLIRKELKARQAVIDHLAEVLKTKDSLIRELHHRVKNNLQSTIGIVEMESVSNGFTETAKIRIVNKLLSLSAVYDLVYNSIDFEHISFADVLRNLLATRLAGLKTEITIREDFQCSVEEMVSIILGINELIEAMRTEDSLASLSLGTNEECGISITAQFNGDVPELEDLQMTKLFFRAADRKLRLERAASSVRLCIESGGSRERPAPH